MLRGRWQREILIIHVDCNEVSGVLFSGSNAASMCGWDEDCATRMSPLTNEEPLMVVKACVDIMWEVVQEDCGDGHDSVVREGEAPLRHGRSGNVHKRAFRAKNRDISRDWGGGGHQGSEILASRGGDENIVRVNGDILVKRGKEEGVEDFLGYLGGSGRHR